MKNEMNIEDKGGSPVLFVHAQPLFRKLILYIQYALVLTVLTMAVMLYTEAMGFQKISLFFSMTSLLTGCVIFVACTSPEINFMKRTFFFWGVLGLLASIGSAFVFWKILSPNAWYYFNLVLIIGICLSLFTETEKRFKQRSILQVVAGIIILLDILGMLIHILGWLDLKLPLLILIGATFVLVLMVIISIGKSTGIQSENSAE